MAIANRDAAVTQYQANLLYWKSVSAAEGFIEAALYLMQEDAASFSIGGQAVTRQNMDKMVEDALKFAKAAHTARPSMFARTRVQNMGR